MSIPVIPHPSRLTWRNFRVVSSIPGTDEEAQVNPETIIPRVRPRQEQGQFRLPDFAISVRPNTRLREGARP